MQEKRHNESQEDYLEGIYVVNQRKGYCRSVDLAEELGYTKASVSVAVSKMKAESQMIERVDVSRGYHIELTFRQDFREFFEVLSETKKEIA